MTLITSRHLNGLPKSYAIARARAQKARLEADGRDVIDLSVGVPFLPPPMEAREALQVAARGSAFNKYPPFEGIERMREAFAAFYERRYGYPLAADRQIVPVIGSKEGLVNLTLAMADEQRPVYCNAVGYPVYRMAAQLAGAKVVDLGGTWEKGYVPELSPEGPEGGIAFVDSPGNPTGAVLTQEAMSNLVTACRARNITFCYDAAYIELRGDSQAKLPLPIFGEEGIVEVHSLSKSFSLAGWRVGFAVGATKIVKALAKMKTFIDSGVPLPIQIAVADMLWRCDQWVDEARETYAQYQRQFRETLVGLPIEGFPSSASMFVWARIPGISGEEVAKACLEEAIVVIPGNSFGPAGAPCFRMTAMLGGERLAELRTRLVRVCDRLVG